MNKGELVACFRRLSEGLDASVCSWLLPAGDGSRCEDLERAVAWLRLFYRFGGVVSPDVSVESFKGVIPVSYRWFLESFRFHSICKCSDGAARRFRVFEDWRWVVMAAVNGVRGVLCWMSGASAPVFIGKGYDVDGSIRDFSRVLGVRGFGTPPDGTLVLDVRLMLGVPMYVLSDFGFKGYVSEKDLIRVLLGLEDDVLCALAEDVERACGGPLLRFSLLYPVIVGGVDYREKMVQGWGVYDDVVRRYGKAFGWLLCAVPRCCGDLGTKQRFKGYVWGLGCSGVVCLALDGGYGLQDASAHWYYDCVSAGDTGSRHVLCQIFGCYDYSVRREWTLGSYVRLASGAWGPRVCGIVTTDISSRPAYTLLGQVVEVVCDGCQEDGMLIRPVIQRVRFDLPEGSVYYAEGIQSVFSSVVKE